MVADCLSQVIFMIFSHSVALSLFCLSWHGVNSTLSMVFGENNEMCIGQSKAKGHLYIRLVHQEEKKKVSSSAVYLGSSRG